MKQQADKKRIDREFQISESVWLKLQPYRQASLWKGTTHKLTAKFYGPYKILDKIERVAY